MSVSFSQIRTFLLDFFSLEKFSFSKRIFKRFLSLSVILFLYTYSWTQCQVTITATSPTCYGQSTGSLQATVNNNCNCPNDVYFRVKNPSGVVLQTSTLVSGLNYTFSGLPALPSGQSYSIEVSQFPSFGPWEICASGGASLIDNTQIGLSAIPSHILCNGQSTGSINLSISGGFIGQFGNPCRGYNLIWTGPTPDPTNFNLGCPPEIVNTSNYTMNSLLAGTYQITVADYNGCQATATVEVNQPPPITPNFTIIDANGCDASSRRSRA